MANEGTEKRKGFLGCLSNMREMMRNGMGGAEGGSCCSCSELMAGMMSKCCPLPAKKEDVPEEPKREEESK